MWKYAESTYFRIVSATERCMSDTLFQDIAISSVERALTQGVN
jgi:hypothetical protein